VESKASFPMVKTELLLLPHLSEREKWAWKRLKQGKGTLFQVLKKSYFIPSLQDKAVKMNGAVMMNVMRTSKGVGDLTVTADYISN